MVICLALMSACCITQVFTRYVLNNSFTWTEELSRYLFIWMIYMSISYGIKKNAHICVEVLVDIMPRKIRPIILLIGDIITLVYCALISFFGYKISAFIYTSGQVSPAMGIPMGIVYISVPIGFSLAVIRIMQRIIGDIQGFSKKEVR